MWGRSGDAETPVAVGADGHLQGIAGFHFLGNAAELVSDVYRPDAYRLSTAGHNPVESNGAGERVVRGCSYADSLDGCRVGHRGQESDYRREEVGFRIVRVPPLRP